MTTTFGRHRRVGRCEFFPRLARGVRTFRTAEELPAAGPTAKSGRDVTTEREAWAR